MGAIKDLVDLVTQLNSSAEDRKFASELRQVQSMIGAIQSEHAEIHEKRIELMTENAELRQEVISLKEEIARLKSEHELAMQSNSSDSSKLNEHEKEILILLSQTENCSTNTIAHRIGQNITKTKFWLERLTDRDFVNYTLTIGSPSNYYLIQDGREFLVNHDLV